MRTGAISVTMLFLALAAHALAQSKAPEIVIHVHLMEARTDRPVRGAVVTVDHLPDRNPAAMFSLRRKTSASGTADFVIPAPVPDQLGISAGLGGGDWHGCSSPIYCTADILQHGAVGANLCWPAWHKDKPQPKFSPRPGDIYIFGHHISGWALGWNEALGLGPGPPVHVPAGAYHPKCPPVAPLLRKQTPKPAASPSHPESK